MKETEQKKMYFFVDESGDPIFRDRRGKDLVKSGAASRIFMIGYLEIEDHTPLSQKINLLREEIRSDNYLSEIPSLKKSLKHFHAKDDSPEVREKVYKLIADLEFKAFIIVYRKNSDHFITKFNSKQDKLYSYLVEKMFENRLHLYSDIRLYFSKMGNVVREKTMMNAVENAKINFSKKWEFDYTNSVKIFVQNPAEMAGLQVIDYILWSVYRLFERKETRYYNYIKDKIALIHDIMDSNNYPKNYYTRENQLDINKISPLD